MEPGLYINGKLEYSWKAAEEKKFIETYEKQLNYVNLDENIWEKDDLTLVIPDDIEKIGPDCFSFCFIKNVYIGKNVIDIHNEAFNIFDYLENIHVHSENSYYSSQDGVLFNKKGTILIKYPEGKENKVYNIPEKTIQLSRTSFDNNRFVENIICNDGLFNIEEFAFADCKELESVTIPNSVKMVGYSLFLNCPKIKEIVFNGHISELEQIENYNKIFSGSTLTISNVKYRKTLDELIEEGYSLRDANKILKNQIQYSKEKIQ